MTQRFEHGLLCFFESDSAKFDSVVALAAALGFALGCAPVFDSTGTALFSTASG